jgi:CopG family nickel-responsive transcriptional regulator
MASDLVRFSVAMPESMLEQFDELSARRGIIANRSEAVRDLIRERLVEEDLESPDVEVVGSITMVYNHHQQGLSQLLDEIQHEHLDVVISKMHVHLDHGNCLETLAVRGSSASVHALADKLLGTKGVRHGKLVCVATEPAMSAECHHHHHHGHGDA